MVGEVRKCTGGRALMMWAFLVPHKLTTSWAWNTSTGSRGTPHPVAGAHHQATRRPSTVTRSMPDSYAMPRL